VFFLDMSQQSVVFPELNLKRVRAMADYLQAAASLGPRQRKTTDDQESTWL